MLAHAAPGRQYCLCLYDDDRRSRLHPLRHEGKLTGLAAYGHPNLADKIAARFSVDDSGRIFSDFCDYPEMAKFIHGIAKGMSREDASASIQQVLESTMLRSIARLLEQNKSRISGSPAVFYTLLLEMS
jgi:predicted NodU family carbamoyl transferase